MPYSCVPCCVAGLDPDADIDLVADALKRFLRDLPEVSCSVLHVE